MSKLLFLLIYSVLLTPIARAQSCPPDPNADKHRQLLVRVEGVGLTTKMQTEAIMVSGYQLVPLFKTEAYTIKDERKQVVWFVASPTKASGSMEYKTSWDEAHAFVARSGDTIKPIYGQQVSVYAEPNIKHCFPYAAGVGTSPDPHWPLGSSFAWHLEEKYTQLRQARKMAAGAGCRPRVTILDTGIFPDQITTPRNVRTDLQKNLLDSQASGDVTDPGIGGLLKNPGHGTATIALLAGNRVSVLEFDDDLGGAPDVDVVPVRIANSVVHFWTKEMAEGISYATNLSDNKGVEYCEVISISMGGVASRAWGDAVNAAYEKGIVVVAAAGNNFLSLPTRYTVYPSRFNRVITVTGATATQKPYQATHVGDMQGNYGPPSVMRKAIAAYTPNVPWAKWGTTDVINLDGCGTSAATPQVAAAAALWMQRNNGSRSGWQRVEAVRHALFRTADKTRPNSREYFGNGLLRAADALVFQPN